MLLRKLQLRRAADWSMIITSQSYFKSRAWTPAISCSTPASKWIKEEQILRILQFIRGGVGRGDDNDHLPPRGCSGLAGLETQPIPASPRHAKSESQAPTPLGLRVRRQTGEGPGLCKSRGTRGAEPFAHEKSPSGNCSSSLAAGAAEAEAEAREADSGDV